ncbi:MAG: GGDEF domain-containing protein, partial [Myxococcales bacterium]|nr:GGDEF domain-containing protein [Myxococcales bacterium]
AEELARTDPLTKLANRRAFEEQIAREFERARRYSRDLSLIVFDLDSFKQINDSHGHAAGDAVLQAVAELALGVSRSSDFVGRIGGEEFAIICPETPAREATTIAERLRAAIDVLAVPLEGATLHTSGSFGVASLSDEIGDVATLMRAADGRMYRAKRRGRNAVVGEPDQHRLLAADAEASRATAEHERRIESIDGEKNREIGGKRESGSTQSGE